MSESVEPVNEPLHVRKVGYTMPASWGALLAAGVITEDEARARGWTPPAPMPRLRRWRFELRWWWDSHKPYVHLGPCDHQDCT